MYIKQFTLSCGLIFLSSQFALAEQKFYSIYDAQGNVINVPVKEEVNPNTQNKALDSQLKSSKHTIKIQPDYTSPANEKKLKVDSVKPSYEVSNTTVIEKQRLPTFPPRPSVKKNIVKSNQELYQFADTDYIDSKVLEKKAFNQDDKQRFFSVPNSMGGVDQVEKRAGVIRKLKEAKSSKLFTSSAISANYQVISKKALTDLLPAQCVPVTQLKKLKSLTNQKKVSLWPSQKDRVSKTQAFDLPIDLIKLNGTMTTVNLVSYSLTSEDPSFYWPLAVFLDKQGCVISGVRGFYLKTLKPTWLQQSALMGSLLVPENSKFLLLTPLAESPYIKNKRLTNVGSLQISTGN